MAKTLYNQFDVVKFASTANILTTNDHAKDYIGIVKEAGDMNSYIEWYDCKSKTTTREVANLTGWMNNIELTLVGSLFHMLTNKTTTLASPVMTKPADNNNIAPEVRVKRKYTRKAGAAKPGPKPKKDKAIVATKPAAKKVIETPETDSTPAVIKVSTPIGKFSKPISKEQLDTNYNYCFATGKFKHFKTRQLIDKSIVDCGAHLYKHINGNLDFVIVGENPGPEKIKKILYYGIPMISEEQWLALIGARGYEFDPNVTNNARLGIPEKK